MEILGLEPTLYVSIECDLKCQEVVKRAWPDVIPFGLIEEIQEQVRPMHLHAHAQPAF